MGCLQPHFDSPYLATSLRDFWGRRWNLTAANTLRFLVYEPILQGMPSPAASLACAGDTVSAHKPRMALM